MPRDHRAGTLVARYRGEDIEADYTAPAILNDYGVPGSPQWTEPGEIEMACCVIAGASFDDPERQLHPDLLTALVALADDLEWEPE